jgi:hypothetical protein
LVGVGADAAALGPLPAPAQPAPGQPAPGLPAPAPQPGGGWNRVAPRQRAAANAPAFRQALAAAPGGPVPVNQIDPHLLRDLAE